MIAEAGTSAYRRSPPGVLTRLLIADSSCFAGEGLAGSRYPESAIQSERRLGQFFRVSSFDRFPMLNAWPPRAKTCASTGTPASRYFWKRRAITREAPRSSFATSKNAGGASLGIVSGIPNGPG